MKKLFGQFIRFFGVSGVGFVLDFSLYYLLTSKVGIPIVYANMVSAIPAITWVFLFSTKKIFQGNTGRLSVWNKYILYLFYQAILVMLVSFFAQWIYESLYPHVLGVAFLQEHLQIICKCIITPITMTCNFFVMKLLTEKM